MNDGARDDGTDQPVSLNNEATPDSAIFSDASPSPTSVAVAVAGTGAAS